MLDWLCHEGGCAVSSSGQRYVLLAKLCCIFRVWCDEEKGIERKIVGEKQMQENERLRGYFSFLSKSYFLTKYLKCPRQSPVDTGSFNDLSLKRSFHFCGCMALILGINWNTFISKICGKLFLVFAIYNFNLSFLKPIPKRKIKYYWQQDEVMWKVEEHGI